MRREVDVAIRETTTALSQVTDLVALVTAPPLHTATIHRIEVLRLQPRVVMVVVIASNGGVTKRAFFFYLICCLLYLIMAVVSAQVIVALEKRANRGLVRGRA